MKPSDPRPGRSVLPVELTHFIGRERELEALRRLMGEVRLLTLTGAGGSGKSRLALELTGQAGVAVAWVELAPIAEPGLVPGAVLRALASSAEGGAATAATVAAAIGNRSLTLVLDNCEHLVDFAAELADSLLPICPHLQIIATSREALGIGGERAWLVPPLALPQPSADTEARAASDAVRLFVDRARDVLPEFSLSASNADAVVDICMRLDGIPLAIELAAARVRHLSVEQIRCRLDDAFALLTMGARTALPRQRTLRATLDWSHELLPAAARAVLRRVAVFRGGFTLEMVEQVAQGPGIAAADVPGIIGLLADRSLIVVREQDGMARYHLLEIMRQYAAQRLAEAGETERSERALALAVSAQVAAAEPHFTTTARREAFAALEPDLDNIREALAWTRAHEPALHVRLVGMLWWFWFSTRHWVEAHRWISGALELPAAAGRSRERAALLFALGALGALRAQSEEARSPLVEAIDIAAERGDGRLEAYASNYLAMTYAAVLSPVALEHAARAERWMRAHDDAYGLRLSLLLGGMAEQSTGNTGAASAMMEEAVAIARSFGQDRELAVALQTFATVLLGQGARERAVDLVHESLVALRRDPSYLFIARALDYYAYSRAEHEPERSARTYGIAEAIRSHIGARRFPPDDAFLTPAAAALRSRLGATYDRCFNDGLLVPPSAALDDVLCDPAVGVRAGSPDPAIVSQMKGGQAPPSTASPTAPAAGPDLDVRVLGTFEVIVGGARVESWPYGKPRELLAYLLLQPDGAGRSAIGAALWPDASPAQVRNSFHVTTHHLRRTLGHAGWVTLDGDRYRIAPDVTVHLDAAVFEDRVRAALRADTADAVRLLRDAVALYRGHFLDGESAGTWRDDEQDRLRRLRCDAGLRLAALLEAAGDVEGAADAYEGVVASEPLHEQAHRGLLLALTATGRRAQALRHYERLTTLLGDLELEPDAETIELYDRIRTADTVPRA